MAFTYIDPKTGATQGFQATTGTTAEPFNVPLLWQASTLSYVQMQADASGNLLTSGGGGGGGSVTQGTVPWVTAPQAYALQLDASAAPLYYVGQAAVGSSFSSSVWQIFQLDTTGGGISILYANGSPTFTNVWNARASLSYS